mmetsp:Transcript_19617/g.49853  ORF Transcript_19617/g.49853 Transcript_19617/m.49853 type:complete len:249 (-) Transcript_19617:984-1730(-)
MVVRKSSYAPPVIVLPSSLAASSKRVAPNLSPSAERRLSTSSRSTVATQSAVTVRPSAVRAPWRTHCHTWEREISAVAASSIRLWMGTQPLPRSHASVYTSATSMLVRTPASVTRPDRPLRERRSSAVTLTSQRRTCSWLGCGMCLSNTSSATLTRSGCATQVPSWPALASRSLSARTLASAASLAALLSLMGICAAMPPMACTPRLWHVLMSSDTYAAMKPLVIVTSPRSGSTNWGCARSFLMNEKM